MCWRDAEFANPYADPVQVFMPADCADLCNRAKALEKCINKECDEGTQPASGSWQDDCNKQEAGLKTLYGIKHDQGLNIQLCPGTPCDMQCEEIGDW